MKKTHIIPLLIIALLTLTPVMSAQAQTARTLPKWRDIKRWLREGQWFYYEVNETITNLMTNYTSKQFVQNNFTITAIRDNIIVVKCHHKQSDKEDVLEFIYNTSDPKLVAYTYPFFMPTNVTNGHTPEKLPKGCWMKVNHTVYIRQVRINKKENRLIANYVKNYVCLYSWMNDTLLVYNSSVYAEISLYRLGLVIKFRLNVTWCFIPLANVTYKATSYSSGYSYIAGALKDTNIALEEVTEVSHQNMNHLFVIIPIIIVAIVIVIVKRRGMK